MSPLQPYLEIALVSAALLLLVIYHVSWALRLRHRPLTTYIGASLRVRDQWVVLVMAEKRDILAVQTLRNWTMAATFLASTAILIGLGLLNVAITSERLVAIAHVLNLFGSHSETLWVIKLVAMALVCFATFFGFTLAIRYYNHAAFLIALPDDQAGTNRSRAIREINRGAICYHLGMRGYYVAMVLAFWLLGPLWLLLCAIGLWLLLRRMDRHDRDQDH